MKKILLNDLESILNTKFSNKLAEKLDSFNLIYENVTESEKFECINQIVKVLFDPNLKKAGEHRANDWNSGWAENLKDVKDNGVDGMIPKYHGKYNHLRWKQNFIKPLVENFDYKIHTVLVDWLFESFMMDVDNIYEFGCGPGYHLLRAHEYNQKANLFGLDWAESSQKIIEEVNNKIDYKITGKNFDFFKPDYSFSIKENSAIYTIAALEQVGNKFDKFLDYLLQNKPKICIHMEPMSEFLDQNNLIDNLSILYFKKRNYLDGFYSKLLELEKQSKINILYSSRTYTGSFFIEGHSIVVWEPK